MRWNFVGMSFNMVDVCRVRRQLPRFMMAARMTFSEPKTCGPKMTRLSKQNLNTPPRICSMSR